MTSSNWTRAVIVLVIGVVYWGGVSVFSGAVEPWDAPLFWPIAYPVAVVLAGFLGFQMPGHAWRWGALLVLSQLVIVLLVASQWSPLFWFGAMVAAVMALPAMLSAWCGARLRRSTGGWRL